MDFEGEIDPEIAARHKALFNDLANEIDNLSSDDEGGSSPPQPVHKTNPKGGSVNKKFKVEPEDDDMDFPKFDNAAYNEFQKGLNMKNNFDDLEKEILGLDSDEEESSHTTKKTVQKPVKETLPAPKQTTGTAPQKGLGLGGLAAAASGTKSTSETKSQVSAPAQTSAASKSTKPASGASFPFNHFIGGDSKILIAIDNKLHGKDALMTLALVSYELEEIIDPCLGSPSIDAEIKKHLETKQKSLLTFKNNIEGMFKQGKLNGTKYLGLVAQMKTKNIGLAQEIQKSNATKELTRVKERLRILMEEEKEYTNKGQGGAATPSASTKTEKKKEASLSDSLKYVPETKISKILPSEIDHLSSAELLDLLKKRKNQYWNLAMYINKEVLKYLEGNELAQKKQYLQSNLIPLIQKATKFIENFDNEDSSDIAEFLKDDLVEVTPALLHGKSLQERSADIQKFVQLLEACSAQESDYVEKLRAALDDPNQVMGASGKKVKEGEKAIEKYGEYLEYLTKLNSDKFMWVPTPKINIGKEQRSISLLNREIDAKAMYVRFKGLEKIDKKKYFIRWHVETASGPTTINTGFCDENSLQFNYQQTVQMTANEKIEQSIENKEIRVEIIYKQMFMEKKKAEGVISLAGFRKNNTLEGKVKLGNDGAELGYLVKIREPLLKYLKLEVMAVHSFQTFEGFDKNAVAPQAPPAEKKPVQASTQDKPKPAVPEEKKTQEPASTSASGGGKLFEKRKYPPLVLLPQATDPLASLSQGELPPGVTLEQAKDPSNPDLINCLGVLKAMAEELEKARTGLAAEGRRADNKVVSDNWAKALKKATILESSFGEGEIDPAQYCDMQKAAMEVDQKLINLYRSKGDNERLVFVQEKLKLTMKELKDLEEAMAAEGDS